MSFCPACTAQRLHTPEEWKEHHPLAGHGYSKETGWTHPEQQSAVEKSTAEQAAKQSEAKS